MTINSGKNAIPEVGHAMYLSDIPLGTIVHNIELHLVAERTLRAAQAHTPSSQLVMGIRVEVPRRDTSNLVTCLPSSVPLKTANTTAGQR